MEREPAPQNGRWRQRLHEIIFEADTPAGKAFDVLLIAAILASVLAVMLDSIADIRAQYGRALYAIEWFFTLLFTAEYVLRLLAVGRPLRYARSFFGIIDLLSILPTWLSLLFPATRYLLVIRVLRVLRIFRIFKLVQFLSEASLIASSLRASGRKIFVFIFSVLTIIVVFGSIMYLVEGEASGFTSIPRSIYWAIVTLTTVGYGDISPATGLGQFIASIIMILGYSIIAVPTGIVTVEMGKAFGKGVSTQACPACAAEGHDIDALFCRRCGEKL